MSQAVVYLARGTGGDRMSANGPMPAAEFGIRSAELFFDHYRRHPAGLAHELVVGLKGWRNESHRERVRSWALGCGARVLDLPDDGLDWGAYFRIAPVITHTWVLFLNTHSRPIGDDWLDKLVGAASRPGCGAVAATGSWGSMASPLPPLELSPAQAVLYPARMLRAAGAFVTSVRDFATFPNPHLRSNAFLFRREFFVEFGTRHGIPRGKRDTHVMESGRAGLPGVLRARGLIPLVVGNDGKAYESDRWIEAATFRVPDQPNLLIEDNQTDFYRFADRFRRRRLEYGSWRRTFTA